MKRREFLKQAGQRSIQLSAGSWLGTTLLSHIKLPSARAASDVTAEAIQALRRATGPSAAIILTPGDLEYANHTASHNRVYESIKPQVIALCLSPEGVQRTLQWAIHYRVSFRVRSGGHCFEDFSIGKDLLIDMSRMNKISCDPPTGGARIQAGARLGDVYATLFASGLILPAGSCFGVGIAGLTLGGGHGYFSRKWGLTCDHLVSVTMVVVDRNAGGVPQVRIVQASATQNPDLFWACRGGGGGSFGIVTEFVFQARRIEPVTQFHLTWTPEDAHAVIAEWQGLAPHADDRLTMALALNVGDGAITGVAVSGVFIGPVDELKPLVKPLLRSGTLLTEGDPFVVRNMEEAIRRYSGTAPLPNRYFKSSSDYAYEPLTSQGIEALLSAAKKIPKGFAGHFQLEAYGGGINRVAPTDSAFPHRRAQYVVQYTSDWNASQDGAANRAWVAQMRQAMRGHFSGYCYVNYCDLGVENYQKAYFGPNAARLSQIKKRVDPHNLFKFKQSVVPA